MRKPIITAAIVILAGVTAAAAIASGAPAGALGTLVYVQGGTFRNRNSNYFGRDVTLSGFYIGKYDVTQKEWVEVMGNNPSRFMGDRLPVEMVSWYDSIEYCNRRSRKEGLQPYYTIDRGKPDPNNLPDPQLGDLDTIRWTVTTNPGANGYRLPTEAEWEYAAEGGQLTRNYTYSGSDDINAVAWYWRNSGDRMLTGFWNWPAIRLNEDQPQPVGRKEPNELGLYDMSGNVRQWCWDWYGDIQSHVTDPQGSPSGYRRVWRGGGWMGAAFCTRTNFRGSLAANGKGPDQGFRVCRNE
jgi:formylglycine-generating enzyme